MRTQHGFTLLEIMVVVAIIAILATMAIPSQTGRITQQKIVETVELVEPYKAQIAAYYHRNNGSFPSNNAAAGLPEPQQIKGNYLEKLEIRDGVMHLYLGQKMIQNLHGKIISIRPTYVADSPSTPISWICGKDERPPGMKTPGINFTNVEILYLPGRCR